MSTTGHESEAINVQGLKASLQKFKTDKVDGKFATKSELSTLEQKLEGPYYDAEHRCIVYPDYETANYNPATRGIYL